MAAPVMGRDVIWPYTTLLADGLLCGGGEGGVSL